MAGCAMCAKPIPKGSSRISLRIRLPEPKKNPNGTLRRTERHNVHPGCLLRTMGSEVKRTGESCWDCGDEYREGDPYSNRRFFSVFTVSRFAYAPLCERCSKKPKWRHCVGCQVFFPSHLVSRVVAPPDRTEVERGALAALEGDDRRAAARHTIRLRVVGDTDPMLCPSCVDDSELVTEASAQEARSEYEDLRDRIARYGIDDA